LDAAERGRARARGYALLAEVIRGRVDLEAVPALAEVVLSGEDAQAEHWRVFGREAPPHASLFRHPDGLLAGDPPLDVLLDVLAVGDPTPLPDLLTWLPALDAAVQGLDCPLYATALDLLRAMLLDHVAELDLAPLDWTLPPQSALLDSPRTGLADIARALAVPSRAGHLFTHRALRRVSAQAGVPAGFGVRWQVIENLLVGAARFDRLHLLREAFETELARAEVCLETWACAPVEPWKRHLADTRALVARVCLSRTG
jgi:hypothetical protein